MILPRCSSLFLLLLDRRKIFEYLFFLPLVRKRITKFFLEISVVSFTLRLLWPVTVSLLLWCNVHFLYSELRRHRLKPRSVYDWILSCPLFMRCQGRRWCTRFDSVLFTLPLLTDRNDMPAQLSTWGPLQLLQHSYAPLVCANNSPFLTQRSQLALWQGPTSALRAPRKRTRYRKALVWHKQWLTCWDWPGGRKTCESFQTCERARGEREREREGSENMAEEKVKAKSHWKFGTQFIVGGGSNYFDIRFLGFALSPLR